MRNIIVGLLLLSLAGCDRLEKPQPKPLDGVPPAVLADGKFYELTAEGYRELKYLPPLELDLSDRSYTRNDSPPGLNSTFQISYFDGKALIKVAVSAVELDGLSKAEAWETNKEQYSQFGPNLELGDREILLEFKNVSSRYASLADSNGGYGGHYLWEYRMSAEEFSKISGARMFWKDK
jgi:hypothetical protein